VWLYTPGVGKQQILRDGDPTPIPGTIYSDFTATIGGGTGRMCAFNASGQALLRTGIVNSPGSSAVTFGVNDVALILASTSGHTVVARRGAPAPGLPGLTLDLLNSDLDLRLNDSGVVAFPSKIAGPGVTAQNDSAIFVGTPGNLMAVVRAGTVIPWSGGSITLGSLFGASLHLNAAGRILFQCTGATGPFSVVGVLCSWDPVDGLQLVGQQNDPIQLVPGPPDLLGSVTLHPNSNGDSRTVAFADDGTVAMKAGLSSPGMILKTRVGGTLTGFPKTISVATGGVHSLFLNASPSNAGKTHLFLGSVTGTFPGFQAGPVFVPLNFDAYTLLVLSHPNTPPFGNTLGTLDASGRAVATLTIPAGLPGIVGLGLHHAFGTLNAFQSGFIFMSEPAQLTFVP
jgi:hypothetical protein